jgi:hypothetical protein
LILAENDQYRGAFALFADFAMILAAANCRKNDLAPIFFGTGTPTFSPADMPM